MTKRGALSGVSAKYATLKQAERGGLVVPRSLLLDGKHTQADVSAFLDELADCRFIVRSAAALEDSHTHSLAGHFWSSGAVSREGVTDTIIQAQNANQAVLNSLHSVDHPQLILQEYIEHSVGGVLFSPWSFFNDYAYIEYSDAGVKQVVAGEGSHSALLCMEPNQCDPLPLADAVGYLKAGLVALCGQLPQVYDFPVDCEWAYDAQKRRVVVLQVRPQTHLIGPVLPYSSVDALSLQGWTGHGLESAISPTEVRDGWRFTALSESLGRLSPLSFSVLQQLYTDSIPVLQLLGCKATSVDFMRYAPDGTVLVDPVREQTFYTLTLFGGFKRGMHQSRVQQQAQCLINGYDHSAAFSYDTLSLLFQYWLAANTVGAGAGRDGAEESGLAADSPHAYELAWVSNPSIEKPVNSRSWSALNRWGKTLFLFELNKLKQELSLAARRRDTNIEPYNAPEQHSSAAKYALFCSWSEYQAGNLGAGKRRQHQQAAYACYDFALLSAKTTEGIQSLASVRTVKGPLYLLENPAVTNDIPAGCILVAPYFDTRWVGLIRHCQGIVVTRGSRLSHSAIVAREYEVPYYVIPQLPLKTLKNGQQMVLDSTGLSAAT